MSDTVPTVAGPKRARGLRIKLVPGIATLSQVARTFGRHESSLQESVKLHFNFP